MDRLKNYLAEEANIDMTNFNGKLINLPIIALVVLLSLAIQAGYGGSVKITPTGISIEGQPSKSLPPKDQ